MGDEEEDGAGGRNVSLVTPRRRSEGMTRKRIEEEDAREEALVAVDDRTELVSSSLLSFSVVPVLRDWAESRP